MDTGRTQHFFDKEPKELFIMKLDLSFTGRSLTELTCGAVVAMVFQDSSYFEGVLSDLDKKMGGFLSRLGQRKFLSGQGDESLLVASNGKILSEKILFWGLGRSDDLQNEFLVMRMQELGAALERIRIHHTGIHIPLQKVGDTVKLLNMEKIIPPFMNGYLRSHGPDKNHTVKIVVSVRDFKSLDFKNSMDDFRSLFEPGIEISVAFEDEEKKAMGF